jgi:exopolysaccharide/PEP-CTERM locus tyrosine autokinase
MSIVERALRRLQKSGSGLSGPPPRGDKSSSARLPRRIAADGSPLALAQHAPLRAPKEFIETTPEMLREVGVIAAEEHESVLADQFRRIKWPILESASGRGAPEGQPANVVMVTSSVANEGKTFTSFNLALSIARERDLSVLLVDADVAKGRATRAFKTEARQGLTDVLAGHIADAEDLVLGTGIAGLTFLPCGSRTDAVPELFASHRMAHVVQALGAADRSRIVLFDSSPLLATNESQVLGRLVDQIVFVVRAESTTQPMVIEALALLDQGKQIRCILNQARASELGEYYYGYGSPQPNESKQ